MLIIKNHSIWAIVSLVLVTLILCVTNYIPGTWLTGWDNLHTEFDFGLNIGRSWNSVWQEYQGLGLLAGMAHGANLLREIFLWLVSFFLPQSFIRYFFHFLMLFVGVLGMYKVIKDILLAHASSSYKVKAAFIGSLFYLLNFGTVQLFFNPFEPFSMFWGVFPWELYALFLYLKQPTRNHIVFLALVNLLATAQALVQTVFLVYLVCVGIILGIYLFQNKVWSALKKAMIVGVVIFSMNAFWLLPNLYFTATNVSATQTAMNNKMNIERFFELNKNHGNINDFVLIRGLNLNFQSDSTGDYLKSWKMHLSSPLVTTIGYILFLVIIIGLLHKHPYRPYLVGIFAITSIVFLSNTPVFSALNEMLRSFPLINQAFRNPFNKFMVPTLFVFSTAFGIGIYVLLLKLSKLNFRQAGAILLLVATSALLYSSLPGLKGEFFSKEVRIQIPEGYFQLFSYLKEQDKNQRIMNLPQDSFWGWGNHVWGSHGSGFLWYGIEQPIMDRAFDVWSNELENYYWQLNYALKKNDTEMFEQIVTKYNIGYILFDASYTPSDAAEHKQLFEQENILRNNPLLTKVKELGPVNLYKVNKASSEKNYISVYQQLPSGGTPEKFSSFDSLYKQTNGYISDTKNPDFFTPFGSLFTNRFQDELPFTIHETKEAIGISTALPKGTYTFTYPSIIDAAVIPVDLYARKQGVSISLQFQIKYPHMFINDQEIPTQPTTFEVPVQGSITPDAILSIYNKEFIPVSNISEEYRFIGHTYLYKNSANTGFYFYNSSTASQELLPPSFGEVAECIRQSEPHEVDKQVTPNGLVLISQNAPACVTHNNPLTVAPSSLMKVSFNYTSQSNESPQFCFYSEAEERCLNNESVQLVPSTNSYVYEEYFLSTTNPKDKFYFTLKVNPGKDKEKEMLKKVEFNNIQITSFGLGAFVPVDIAQLPQQLNSFPVVSTTENDTVTVIMEKANTLFSMNDVLKEKGYKSSVIEPVAENGTFFIQTIDDNTQKRVRFHTQNAGMNAWIDVSEWDTSIPAFISFESRTTSGFPLTFSVSTIGENHKFMQSFAPKSKEFSRSYYVIPPLYAFDKGLKLQFNNTSLNKTPSYHEIQNIAIHPIPYEFITGIVLKKDTAQFFEVNKVPVNSTKISLHRYEVDGSVLKAGNILSLSQAHQDGWAAYKVATNGISTHFPMLFGTKVGNKVKVNGWANGWKLHEDCTRDCKILLLYWPQYLQWLGFGVPVFALLYLLLKKNRA